MRDRSKRVATLEAGTLGAVTVRDAIDRPPQETREEWIARQAAQAVVGSLTADCPDRLARFGFSRHGGRLAYKEKAGPPGGVLF